MSNRKKITKEAYKALKKVNAPTIVLEVETVYYVSYTDKPKKKSPSLKRSSQIGKKHRSPDTVMRLSENYRHRATAAKLTKTINLALNHTIKYLAAKPRGEDTVSNMFKALSKEMGVSLDACRQRMYPLIRAGIVVEAYRPSLGDGA